MDEKVSNKKIVIDVLLAKVIASGIFFAACLSYQSILAYKLVVE
jgi:hypothetical protein